MTKSLPRMTRLTNQIAILPKFGSVLLVALLCVLNVNARNEKPYATRGSDGKNRDIDFSLNSVFAKTITGKIMNSNGEYLVGANIVVKGTTTGTISDTDGNFSLSVPDENAVLVVSFTGYATQEVALNGKSNLNITLETDEAQLGEVVVVGYGTQKKSDLTGSVSSVKGGDLNKLPTQRVDQALQGRAAGVYVQNTDGAPGGSTIIRIRGGNSITGSNNALVVVDGLQGADISTLNPNDIESVEVLKDASATAIYGARGANGVILVTTKRGAAGKTNFNYGFSIGSQELGNKLDLLNAADYARKSNAWAATQNGTNGAPITPVLPFDETQIAALAAGGGTDWQDQIYRKGSMQNHQLSAGGGTENARYFVSGGYMDQQGILVNTAYKRYNLRSNLDLKFNNWISGGLNLNLTKAKGNVPPVGEGTRFGDILGQVINTVARFDPATPVYDATGNYNFKALKGGAAKTKIYADPDVWNPLATALETSAEKNSLNSEISTFLEFKLLEGLTFRVTGSAGIYNTDDKFYYSSLTQPGRGAPGTGNLQEDKYQSYQNSNILTYSKVFNDKHNLTVTGVAEQQYVQNKGSFLGVNGFFSDITGIENLGGAANIGEKYNYNTVQTLNSFLGRINYVFDSKYMLTASMRADGSSVFGANNKWGYFPSVAVAWRLSEERFIKNLGLFSNLKLRGSWGKTGNQGIAPYQSLSTVASGFFYDYNGTVSPSPGYSLGTAANPNLKWETTAQTNIGGDLGFFNDRLYATVDVYNKLTEDLLLNKQVEAYSGFSSVLSNVGSIENKGLELSLGGKPLAGKDLKWNTGFVISFNRSKVVSLADGATFLSVRTNTGGGYRIWTGGNNALKQLRVGEPVDQMLGYVTTTWSQAEAAEAKKYGQAPGEMKFSDVNGDGKITRAADGQQVIGNASPDFIYGWHNNISFKGFDLAFLFQGSQGNEIFNATRIKLEAPNYGTSANLNNRWTPDNQNTNVPVFLSSRERQALALGANKTTDATGGTDNRWSRYVEDGSYLRLKNITFTYNLPTDLLSKIKVAKLAAYVTASNLLTFTKYTGYDPEVSSFNKGTAGGNGIDLSNYPTAKTVIFGINLGF